MKCSILQATHSNETGRQQTAVVSLDMSFRIFTIHSRCIKAFLAPDIVLMQPTEFLAGSTQWIEPVVDLVKHCIL